MDEEKERRLQLLERKIWECDKCDFNEKTDARFCGGKGNDFRAMFITKLPSTSRGTGKFPGKDNYCSTNADDLFNDVREKFGLQHCYTTDFVKCGKRSERTVPVHKIRQCIDYLREEMEIVRPKVIVAVGKELQTTPKLSKNSFDLLIMKYLNTKIPVLTTWHYYYVNRYLRNKPKEMRKYEQQHSIILKYI